MRGGGRRETPCGWKELSTPGLYTSRLQTSEHASSGELPGNWVETNTLPPGVFTAGKGVLCLKLKMGKIMGIKTQKDRKDWRLNSSTRSLGIRLKSLGYGSYDEYLRSDHWRDVRVRMYKSKLIKKNGENICCTYCNNVGVTLNVHHRSYKSLGNENLNHLVVLCNDCHRLCHDIERGGYNLWRATKKVKRMRKHEDSQN